MSKQKEARFGVLTRSVTKAECPLLNENLPIRKKVYEHIGYIPASWEMREGMVLVKDKKDSILFYEVPNDAVLWIKGPEVITYPTNEACIELLENKHKTYQNRKLDNDTRCKREILAVLRKDKTVKREDIVDRLAQKYGTECLMRFNQAFAVINDYCTTGGKRVRNREQEAL